MNRQQAKSQVYLLRKLAKLAEKADAAKGQQAQLDFLGQQVKLLELIQEHGLDAVGVLGDMALGLETNPSMLAEAMARAVKGIAGSL